MTMNTISASMAIARPPSQRVLNIDFYTPTQATKARTNPTMYPIDPSARLRASYTDFVEFSSRRFVIEHYTESFKYRGVVE